MKKQLMNNKILPKMISIDFSKKLKEINASVINVGRLIK